jgi:hypothetical protein
MTPTVALQQIIQAVESTESTSLQPEATLGIALSRLGAPDQSIISGTLQELAELPEHRYGNPLHALVIVGRRLHPLEVEFAQVWAVHDGWKTVSEGLCIWRQGLGLIGPNNSSELYKCDLFVASPITAISKFPRQGWCR